jgi:hypothetical protein
MTNDPTPTTRPQTEAEVTRLAKSHWDADRAALKVSDPWWPMTAWGAARAWKRRPYVRAAKEGKHPDAN